MMWAAVLVVEGPGFFAILPTEAESSVFGGQFLPAVDMPR